MTTAEVRLWGRTVGAVNVPGSASAAAFEYAPSFIRAGWDVAPLTMPRQPGVFQFPDLVGETFRGLPGLLAESLPDHFGRLVIDSWLQERNQSLGDLDAVEMLCYVGRRGMGALEFEPALVDDPTGRAVNIEDLARLAAMALENRRTVGGHLLDGQPNQDVWRELFHSGTSAGGANPKAIVAWNESTGEVRSGEVVDDQDFGHWIVKFDRGGSIASVARDEGAVEFAYSELARGAGIAMAECRLARAGRRRHFMTRRFDRTPGGRKVHMQTLGGLAHWDFRHGGTASYESAFAIVRRLGLPMVDVETLFRRTVFNVLVSNRDDHVKNIGFLMDETGNWSLAPAYDLTYVFEGAMGETYKHQMTINGKVDGFKRADLLACGASAGVARARAADLVEDVREAVSGWRFVAEDCGVRAARLDVIARKIREVDAYLD